jgi:DHA1 family bicyclomycin/chloramphenicol resistance-like MFS transporter
MRLFSRVVIGPRIVPLAALFVGLGPLSTDVYLPLLPQVARTFNVPNATATVTITAVLLGLAVGQILAGPLSDQRGRRSVLLLGMVLFVITTLLSALAPSILLLIVIRFLAGIAAAFGFVIARAMVADVLHATELARGYALMGAITAMAPVASPIIGGILALWLDWRGVFLVLAGIGVLFYIITYVKVPETLPVAQRTASGVGHALRDLGGLLGSRNFMAYVVMLGCAGGMLFSYIGSSSFVLEERFGLSPTVYGGVFALNAFGTFVVALIGRRVVRLTGPDRLLWVGQAGTVLGSVIVLFGLVVGALPIILVGMFVAIAFNTLNFANNMALGFSHAPAGRGSASALLGIASFAVGGALAPVSGLGPDMLGVMMVIFTVLAMVLHATMAPRGGAAAPASSPATA